MTTYLEIASAIIVTFFTLSLVVTSLTETLSVLLNQRGRLLLGTVETLLGSADLRKRLLETAPLKPLVRSLGSSFMERQRFPNTLPPRRVAEAMMAVTEGSDTTGPIAQLIAQAEATAQDATDALTSFYEDMIAQLRIRYKRRQQVISVLIGFVLAASVNLNVVDMARTLHANDVQREAFVSYIDGVLSDGLPDSSDEDPSGVPDPSGEDLLELEIAEDLVESLETLSVVSELPGFGWQGAEVGTWRLAEWSGALVAYLLAAFASVLGAPFWFDLLTRTRAVGRAVLPRP